MGCFGYFTCGSKYNLNLFLLRAFSNPRPCSGSLPLGLQPPESFSLFDKYTAQLYLWNLSFEKFMLRKGQSFNSKQVRGAALLKIHHTAAKIISGVSTNMSDLRSVAEVLNAAERFIEHTDDFQIILNLSRSIIATAEQDAKIGKPSLTFSTDLGLIGPLYYTCVKCSNQSMRMTAIELILRCPRREGMWNSILVAKMIEEYWELEARHKVAQETGEEVDEFGFPVPLTDTVALTFMDGMKWEWKWKSPSMRRSRTNSPGFLWTDIMEAQSIFKDSDLPYRDG